MENTVNEKIVSLVSCGDYETDTVRKALERALEPIGGLSFVRQGMTVAIKVNLIAPMEPSKSATTHPVLVTELCRMLKERGAKVIVGDSPGGVFTPVYLKSCYKAAGLMMVQEAGAVLNEDCSTKDTAFAQAVCGNTFTYTSWLDQADVIIDFCKLKTHGMMTMTGSIKNLFGTIPGLTKPEYHMRFPNIVAFSNFLIDLNEYFRPALYICDAVNCMEGNGPTSGHTRYMGALLASKNGYYMDMAMAQLIGLTKEDVCTLQEAHKRGLGPASFDDVEMTGEPIENFRITDFRRSEEMSIAFAKSGPLWAVFSKTISRLLETRPQVQRSECIGCAKCAGICPAKAIEMKNNGQQGGKNYPDIDRSKCIKCFCCQEFCPVGAMKVHRSGVAKFLSGSHKKN